MTDNRTTELREKLDALGIEHFDYDKGGRTQTMWESSEGMRHFTYETAANPAKTAKLIIGWFPTPEQAIAATLGSGTCEMEYGGDITLDTARVMGVYFCSECGSPIYNDCMPHFCGYCGKAVKR